MNKFLITFDISGATHHNNSCLEILQVLRMYGNVDELATSTTLLFETKMYANADQISDFIKRCVSDNRAKVSVNVVRLIGEKGIDYSLQFAE